MQSGTASGAALPQPRISLFKTVDQAAAAAATDIAWGTAVGRDLVLVSPSVSLRPNKAYRLRASLLASTFSDPVDGFITYQWVDAANVVLAAATSSPGTIAPQVAATVAPILGNPVALTIVTPTVTTLAKLRIIAATGTATILRAGSWAEIEEIL